MQLLEIVQTVFDLKAITPDLETQINDILWSRELDRQERQALAKLVEGVERGMIAISTPQVPMAV
ncbi:MAG: hypothetical protein SFW36_21425 [Leptolyngbyaceae cyanobacterium bins.59]|nr:hypothetical protein [Leptolyngbyaceae cyanobacterium bins.59]